jgi:hypothetical protein
MSVRFSNHMVPDLIQQLVWDTLVIIRGGPVAQRDQRAINRGDRLSCGLRGAKPAGRRVCARHPKSGGCWP